MTLGCVKNQIFRRLLISIHTTYEKRATLFWSPKSKPPSTTSKRCRWRICNENARGFNIISATPEDTDAILGCLRRTVYWDDPLIQTLGLRKRMSQTLEELPLKILHEGLSLMAIARNRKAAQGVALACTIRHNERDSPCEETRAAVGCRGRNLIAFREHCVRSADVLNAHLASHALEVRCLGTVPEERRKGIASALLERVIAVAREREFPLVCIHCSTAEGRRVAEKAGMAEAWSTALASFRDERGRPVFKKAQPHHRVSVMVTSLRPLAYEHHRSAEPSALPHYDRLISLQNSK